MFSCKQAPPEPFYEADLEKLGFRLDEHNKFVNTRTGEVFDYYHTNNEHANDLRKEAFHTAARAKIAEVLREEYGITELYLTGSKIHTERPQEPHVSILSTKVSDLKKKRDIVVVIGEAGADAGIWAWRVAGKEGGIEKGSVVGLAKRLAEFKEGGKKFDKDATPGLIVLNPGQLLYSHKMNKNMTVTSWNHRRRVDALSGDFSIDPQYNFVQSHVNPHRHIHTCFEHILQQIMPDGARVYCIMIGDGATNGLHTLDNIVMNKNLTEIRGGKLEAMALVSPCQEDITPQALICNRFKDFLAKQGRAWVTSDSVAKNAPVSKPSSGTPAIGWTPGDQKIEITPPPTDAEVKIITRDLETTTLEPGNENNKPAIRSRIESEFDAADEKARLAAETAKHGSEGGSTNLPPPTKTPVPAAWSLPPTKTPVRAAHKLPPPTKTPLSAAWNLPPPTKTPVAAPADTATEWLQEDKAVETPPVPFSTYTVSAGPNEGGAQELVFPELQEEVIDFIFFHVERARDWELHPERRPQPSESE